MIGRKFTVSMKDAKSRKHQPSVWTPGPNYGRDPLSYPNKLTRSSRYTSQSVSPDKTFCISRWNGAGAFRIPNAVNVYCGKPSGVNNTEISLARAVKGTCQYALRKSSLVTEPIRSPQSSVQGKGKESAFGHAIDLIVIRAKAERRFVH